MKPLLILFISLMTSNFLFGQEIITDTEDLLDLKEKGVKLKRQITKYGLFKKNISEYRYVYTDSTIIEYEPINSDEQQINTYFWDAKLNRIDSIVETYTTPTDTFNNRITFFYCNQKGQLLKKQFLRSIKEKGYAIDTFFYNDFGQLDSVINYDNDFFNTGQINTGNNLAVKGKKVYRYYNQDIDAKPYEIQHYGFHNKKWKIFRIYQSTWDFNTGTLLYDITKIPIPHTELMITKYRDERHYDENGRFTGSTFRRYKIGDTGKSILESYKTMTTKNMLFRKNWVKNKYKDFYIVINQYGQVEELQLGKTRTSKYKTILEIEYY